MDIHVKEQKTFFSFLYNSSAPDCSPKNIYDLFFRVKQNLRVHTKRVNEAFNCRNMEIWTFSFRSLWVMGFMRWAKVRRIQIRAREMSNLISHFQIAFWGQKSETENIFVIKIFTSQLKARLIGRQSRKLWKHFSVVNSTQIFDGYEKWRREASNEQNKNKINAWNSISADVLGLLTKRNI